MVGAQKHQRRIIYLFATHFEKRGKQTLQRKTDLLFFNLQCRYPLRFRAGRGQDDMNLGFLIKNLSPLSRQETQIKQAEGQVKHSYWAD